MREAARDRRFVDRNLFRGVIGRFAYSSALVAHTE
jgi:hypothetical protein